MIGQRGPLQATLTSKELRELSRLRDSQPHLCRDDFTAIGRLVDSKHKTECLQLTTTCTLLDLVLNDIDGSGTCTYGLATQVFLQFSLSTAEFCMTCFVYRFA